MGVAMTVIPAVGGQAVPIKYLGVEMGNIKVLPAFQEARAR